MVVRFGELEYPINSFIVFYGTNFGGGDHAPKDSISIVFTNGINYDIYEVDKEVKANYNNTMTISNAMHDYVYEGYEYINTSTAITDSSYEFMLNFEKQGDN